MRTFRFTGNPFVDAGIAGMCAAAGVDSPDALDEAAVEKAVGVLTGLLAGEFAFKPRTVGKKQTVFASSEFSVIFPNSAHCNPSIKPGTKGKVYEERVARKKDALLLDDAGDRATKVLCSVDGSPASFDVGNDEFPLVDSKSKLNFHPGHREGQPVSAATALALEFFPLSVLRTGRNEGYFWFVHTEDPQIAVACAKLTLATMNNAVARNEGLGFFGEWRIAAKDSEAAFVALIRDITGGGGDTPLRRRTLNYANVPVTAYVFSNDNRGAVITAHDLPHEMFSFFGALNRTETGMSRFQREVLENDKTCWRVARLMMRQEPIVRACALVPAKTMPGKLLGGWEAHSLYATEVLGMRGEFVQTVEAVSERVFEHDKRNDTILALRQKDARPGAILLRLSRLGLLSAQEMEILMPPDNRRAGFLVRDYLLVALFERQWAEEKGEPFRAWTPPKDWQETEREKHPLIRLTERLGAEITAGGRGKQAAAELARSRSISELRSIFVRLAARHLVAWPDFVGLFPLEAERGQYPAFLVRDYLLAFLYDRLRNETDIDDLPLPEEAVGK